MHHDRALAALHGGEEHKMLRENEPDGSFQFESAAAACGVAFSTRLEFSDEAKGAHNRRRMPKFE